MSACRCTRCKIDFWKNPLDACDVCPECARGDQQADRARFWWRYPQPEWETKTFINAGHPLSLVAKPQLLLKDPDQAVWDFLDNY